jgi:uncharacterized RDD family membrane protein YckC
MARSDQGQARILTGEAVHLDIRVAGIGSRGLARLVDLVIQIILFYLLMSLGTVIIAWLGISRLITLDAAVFTSFYIVLTTAVFVGYPVMMETLTRGRTVGKLVFGLRVVRDDGGPVTFRQALTRALVALSIEWPGLLGAPITWLVTIWVMIASPLNKRLGDHVAGTIVIHERTPTAWGWVPAMPGHLAPWAATLDLTALDDDLALAVRSFLARNRHLREPARTVLGDRLVREVAAVTNPPPPPGTPGWMYLAAVHAERHRRARVQLESVRARAATVWPDLASAIAAPPLTSQVGTGITRPAAAPGTVPTVRPAQPDGALSQ